MAQQSTDSAIVHVVVPRPLGNAVRLGASRQLMTVAEYIRRSMVDRLRADGIDPAAVQDSRN
jgi:hypothetical protein